MTIFNDEMFIGFFIAIAIFLGQYLFSKFKSLYSYTNAIYFGLEKNVDIQKKV